MVLVFPEVNRLFVLSFEINTERTVHTKYYLPTFKIIDYKFIIDGRNFFNKPIKNNLKRYENDRKIATDQRDDYTASCLLD